MARPRSGDKRADIREATIREVVERGVSRASVNSIAGRARLSVGTIYRYFENKDDLLASVFFDVKQDVHATLMSEADRHDTASERIRAVWFALVGHARENPDDFLFAEAVLGEVDLSDEQRRGVDRMAGEMGAILRSAMDDGTLAPARVPAVMAVLTAPAIQLARRAALANAAPDMALAEEIFEITWRAIESR